MEQITYLGQVSSGNASSSALRVSELVGWLHYMHVCVRVCMRARVRVCVGGWVPL